MINRIRKLSLSHFSECGTLHIHTPGRAEMDVISALENIAATSFRNLAQLQSQVALCQFSADIMLSRRKQQMCFATSLRELTSLGAMLGIAISFVQQRVCKDVEDEAPPITLCLKGTRKPTRLKYMV